MVAGLIAVLVGYTSSVVLIIQAATAAGADAAQVSSWLWTLGIGMGVSCIGLSLLPGACLDGLVHPVPPCSSPAWELQSGWKPSAPSSSLHC